MKILGCWSGHDASFATLIDGKPHLHIELERHSRVKEGAGDSIQLFYDHDGDDNIDAIATCFQPSGIKAHADNWTRISARAPLYVCGHHQSHAAHAFYSSPFERALVITTDGGGIEDAGGFTAGITVWKGENTKLINLARFPLHMSDIGGIWSRAIRYIFSLESGHPYGNAAGTAMALAAFGDPQKWLTDFKLMFYRDMPHVTAHPPGHIRGMSSKDPLRPRHPYLGRFEDIAKCDQQEAFNMAASLQRATEDFFFDVLKKALNAYPCKDLCIAGGVSLNSVMIGKIKTAFPEIDRVYVPPVPYDGGLTIGAAQWLWHDHMGNPRIDWGNGRFSPYLGVQYDQKTVDEAITARLNELNVSTCTDDYVIDKLISGEIISVFNGRAESGRRALGNRSILADPRHAETKDRVNKKIKHREDYRPFAPSILKERVGDWFTEDQESPYMNAVLQFRDDKKYLVPAVVHRDGSGRLQTVTREQNTWYYNFIKQFELKTGVPILLNTSFNSREPICETPAHAIDCFLRTELDALYFPEHNLLCEKRK